MIPKRGKMRIRVFPSPLLSVQGVSVAVCIFACLTATCEGFFFPKSFFRRSNETPTTTPGSVQQQQHPRVIAGGHHNEPLQGSGTDVQPALRIVNRPPPPRSQDQVGQPSGSGFHVPRELCLACERFPWMPVAGGERSQFATASAPQSQQQFVSHLAQSSTPTKTIVINALGEAQGPVPIPPAIPSRRPFAIQFDGSHSANQVAQDNRQVQNTVAQQNPPNNQQFQKVVQQEVVQPKPAERPVSFQIYQAQPNQPPTVLQQQSNHVIGLQPPPVPQVGVSQTPYRPTVLFPVGQSSAQVGANLNVQSNHGPPNPVQVGTLIAAQQNNVQFENFEQAKLVYQEHLTNQQSQGPPAPQNFKVPIIPQTGGNSDGRQPQVDNIATNSIIPQHPPNQQNFGAPPQQDNYRPGMFLQMRPPPLPFHLPPRLSLNMKPPGPIVHYGRPVRIPNNIGPQRPSGQVIFPQNLVQMGPPPVHQQQPQQQDFPRPDGNLVDGGERRPAPSGQVVNVQPPIQLPKPTSHFSNNINTVPIPIPTPQNVPPPNKGEPTFSQETGWEIIPSIQTDLTHLFAAEKGKPLQAGNELPVPVPIPVPQSHPPKAPFFIVAGQQQQQQHQQEEQLPEEQIKVQDVTYHEESRVPTAPVPVSNPPHREEAPGQVQQLPEPVVSVAPVPQPIARPRPFILGIPTEQRRPIIFRPHPHQPQPVQQLHPSIMTALNHAQQTSFLTHQYFRQPNLVGQVIRENSIYVSPAQNPQKVQQLPSNSVESEPNSEQYEGNNLDNPGIDPRIPSSSSLSVDQTNPNCQGAAQQNPNLIQISDHQKAQQETQENQDSGVDHSDNDQSQSTHDLNNAQDTEQTYSSSVPPARPTVETSAAESGVRSTVNIQDNGNKGSYLIYYQRPVSKSPVYWVQPSRTLSQGVVRLSPQLSPQTPPVASMVSWSRPRVVVANQFRTEHHQPQDQENQDVIQDARSQESFERAEYESGQASNEESIPFGTKLGAPRDSNKIQTPYDIISVGGSDDEAQSLEEASPSNDNEQGHESPEQQNNFSDDNVSSQDLTGPGSDQEPATSEPPAQTGSDSYQNEELLQNVQETKDSGDHDDADDERDDFGFRPQTTFRKPISTTVIHSPGASSFQSVKLPNFKPQRVIVHDFTSHSANAAATGPSAAASEPQQSIQSSSTEDRPSETPPQNVWAPLNKVKAAKFVENDEESSESIQRPQGFNIQEVIASGPVQTADCLTTPHSGHLLTSFSSTSPRTADSLAGTHAKGRDIFLPIGSRFPGGRPSIFSAIRRPIPAIVPTTTTSTTTLTPSTSTASQESYSKRERFLPQSPSGFAASIPIPVYHRRPITNHVDESLQPEESIAGTVPSSNSYTEPSTTYQKRPSFVLSAEDIYKPSEVKQERVTEEPLRFVESSTSILSSPGESETTEPIEEMSTEKSSSFSISVVDENNQAVKLPKVVVTSVPVSSSDFLPTTLSPETLSSTTAIPPPASTSTKIVKTVRVRQRMRSGSFNGPLRTRFNVGSRVRVVHRPANQEYIRHFPEFSTNDDKLAKDEEQEVKNALIELKKSNDSDH